jgi:glycerol-3-phosphate dehydrogenase (NAD(P)+)
MKHVVIIGAGVMGSAMAFPFCDRGWQVSLIGTPLDDSVIDNIQTTGMHPKLNVVMPKNLVAHKYSDWFSKQPLDADLILLGVASAGIPWAVETLLAVLRQPIPILMITKGLGLDNENLVAMPDMVQRALAKKFDAGVAVAGIAGPCIAGELAARRNTGTVIVARDLAYAENLCQELATEYYHPRASSDMMGVEICAAFKNFFAIAVGFAHGQLSKLPVAENNALNNNAAAMLFDQAIRELMVLALAHDGLAETVWGMPGAGDLYVTCMAGRNSRLGHQLGRGLTYAEVKSGPMKEDTIEGAELGLAVGQHLRQKMRAGILNEKSLPLTNALLDALMDSKPLTIPWSKLQD